MNIDTETLLCAVIGNPVAHSLSPAIHNAAFEALGINAAYLAFHVTDVAACLTGMRALPSFRGMSVTIPHKEAVMPFLDEIDPLARRVGCVNTVTNDHGRLKGMTTDGPGTLRAFQEAGVDLRGRRLLFTGAGGAVRAVAFAMAGHSEPAAITILGRNPERMQTLAADLRDATGVPVECGALGEDAGEIVTRHDVIIQGTPIGMFGHGEKQSCIPAAALESRHVVFDMIYRPLETQLLADARRAGCTLISGTEMLVNQAAIQFETWTGSEAPRDVMRSALLTALSGGK